MLQALELDLWSGVSLFPVLWPGVLPCALPACSHLPELTRLLPRLARFTCDCRDFVSVTLSVLLMQGAVSVAQRVY